MQDVSAVVNADDLGMSSEVNDAIFELMDRRRLTSASLLANAPATLDAVRKLRKFPQCSFGVHLNIVEYKPLGTDPGLSPLLDGEGKLKPVPSGFRFTMGMLRAIHEEFNLQIRRLLSIGVPISHLDSHMHLHLRPALFPVIKALQRTFKIRGVRTKYNLIAAGEPVHWQRTLKTAVYNWAMRHTCHSITADTGSDLSAFVSAQWEPRQRFRTVELLAHPGNPYYPGDTELLLSPWEQELPFRVHFINFYQLGEGPSADHAIPSA